MRESKQKYGGSVPKKAYKKSKSIGSQSSVLVPSSSYVDFDGIPEKPLPPKENSTLNILLEYLPTEPVAFKKFCYGFCQLYKPVIEELSDRFNKKVASYKGNLHLDSDGEKRANEIAKGFEHIQTSLNLLKRYSEKRKNQIISQDTISTSLAMENVLSHLKVIKRELESLD